jgi:hypothetical protein
MCYNVLRRYLISRGSDLPLILIPLILIPLILIPLILILFGVIGGAVTFGALGLFLRPTLSSVGYGVKRHAMLTP